jgi:hypothetical protein
VPAVLTAASALRCAHGGTIVDAAPYPRVRVSGQPVATLAGAFTVAGCPASPPCVTAQFTQGALRVRAGGAPLVTTASPGISLPNGSPVVSAPSPVRVAVR